MKKLYSTQNWIKVTSLGTAMAALLSSVSPVFAAGVSITEGFVRNSSGTDGPYPKRSYTSIVFAGDDDYCGVDNVIGRGGSTQGFNNQITAEEQYNRFIEDRTFNGRNPYGTTTEKVTWVRDGVLSNSSGSYMGTATVGLQSVLLEAYGVYSFATSCGFSATGNYSTVFGAEAVRKAGGAQAFSVGDTENDITRQITGVAAGASGTDAMNVAPLKAMKDLVVGAWQLVVNDETPIDVNAGSIVKFVGVKAEEDNEDSRNIKITKGNNNEVQFDLNDIIRVKRVIAGKANVSDVGFVITGGPNMTIGGINAGNKQITGVANGIRENDAVNVSQLNELKNQIAGDSLVNWVEEQKLITVGAEKGGTRIDIAGSEGNRIIAGVKAAENDNEAVNKKQLDGHIADITDIINNIKTESAFAVLYDKNGDNTVNYNNVTLGGGKSDGPVALLNVKDGKITKESHDAINGSQINKISGDIAKFFGGDAAFEGGVFVGPRYNLSAVFADGNVEQKVFEDVGSALTGLDVNVRSVNSRLTYVANSFNQQIENFSKNALMWSDTENAFVALHGLGGDKTDSKITYLLNGDISEDSTDAINGSQLYMMSNKLAAYFGGGARYENGQWSDPTFTLHQFNPDGNFVEKNYKTVADAFGGVDTVIKDIYSKLGDLPGGGVKDQDALMWSETENAFVALHGLEGKKTNSKLKFLLDGAIEQGSSEAITGNQLYMMSNQLAAYFGGGARYENGQWLDPTFMLHQLNPDGSVVEKSYKTVADAFGGVDSSLSNLNDRLKAVEQGASPVPPSSDSDVLHWNEGKGGYDASHKGQPGKITEVADGNIAQGSKDAVNGGQLWETNERLSGVEQDIQHISDRVDNISNTIADIGEMVNEMTDGAVSYDRDEDGNKTNKISLQGGNAGEPVVIDNVADGKIEKGSKEAVNGGQLHDYTEQQMKVALDDAKKYTDERIKNITVDAIDDAVSQAKDYTDMKFEALNYGIEGARKEARQAAAIGLAVSNLRYNDTPGKLSIAFGSGLWRSQGAFAFGAGYTSESGAIRSNLSVTSSGGHWGIGAGLGLTLN
ncbi:Vomp family autotransporter [Bartonella quintana]|uniref:Vomp family autotransporter n=1 Tax=Bartonella quintana TaxID=803 RepID=UPI00027FCB3B|nr:Vomp family autotransporter [Bartonella quintana]AFR25874.1 adhesin [Bartonella quintana RM-11]